MSYGGYPPQHGHSTPAPGQHPAPGYGAPPPQQGYGAPPPQQGYGAPPPQQGYGASPPQQGYRSPPPQQYGGGGYGGGYGQQAPGPGGFAGGPPPSAPPGADPQLWGWFTAVDTDRSGHISAHELQKALVNGDWTPFDLDTVKLLMTIFDTDRSGTIAFNEFAGLWKYIKEWQGVYKHFDKDRSGSIDGNELKEALSQFGYKLSPPLLSLLEKKYDVDQASAPSVPGQRGPPAGITFDRFVRACVVIRTLTEAFQKLDTDRDGWIQISYDQFMNTVLSAP